MRKPVLRTAVMGIALAVVGLSCSESLPPPPPSSQPMDAPHHDAVRPPVIVPASNGNPPVKVGPRVEKARPTVASSPESPVTALSERIGRFLRSIKELQREQPERRVAEADRRLQELLNAYPENPLARVRILAAAADVFQFLEPDSNHLREMQFRQDTATLAKQIALEGVVLEKRSQYQLALCLSTNGKKDDAKTILQSLVEFKYFDTQWESRMEELKAIYHDAAISLFLMTPDEELNRLRFVPFVMSEIEEMYPEEFRRMPKGLYLPGMDKTEAAARAVVESRLLKSPEGSELRKHLEATLKHLLESKR